MGQAETTIVIVKVVILAIFVSAGMFSMQWVRLEPDTWSAPLPLLAGGMLIFLAYEGFELIANTAADIRDPQRNLHNQSHEPFISLWDWLWFFTSL